MMSESRLPILYLWHPLQPSHPTYPAPTLTQFSPYSDIHHFFSTAIEQWQVDRGRWPSHNDAQ